MTATSLRCRLGLHDWYVNRGPEGDKYQACSRCPAQREAIAIADQASGNASTSAWM